MIAVDTNILVYAHRVESPFHSAAAGALRALAEGTAVWAIPWPCVHEFLGVVTHPRMHAEPTPIGSALQAVEDILAIPNLILAAEGPGYWPALRSLLISGGAVGPRVHDARIAAICLVHGVSELWTADRDFGRFPQLKVVNPLVGR